MVLGSQNSPDDELLEELELLDELVPEPVQTGGEKLPSCVP
jgi:hypothetical protein